MLPATISPLMRPRARVAARAAGRIAWSRRGERLVFGGHDALVVADTVSGVVLARHPTDRPYSAAACARDDSFVVCGDDGGGLDAWRFDAGRPGAPPAQHAGRVNAVAFSGDDWRFFTASDDGTVGRFNAASWEARFWRVGGRALDVAHAGARDELAVALGLAGVALLACDGRAATLRPTGRAISVAWSSDGELLFAGTREGRLHVWDAARREAVRAPVDLAIGPLWRLAPLAGALLVEGGDGWLAILDAASGVERGRARIGAGPAGGSLAVHAGQRAAAIAAGDGVLVLDIELDAAPLPELDLAADVERAPVPARERRDRATPPLDATVRDDVTPAPGDGARQHAATPPLDALGQGPGDATAPLYRAVTPRAPDDARLERRDAATQPKHPPVPRSSAPVARVRRDVPTQPKHPPVPHSGDEARVRSDAPTQPKHAAASPPPPASSPVQSHAPTVPNRPVATRRLEGVTSESGQTRTLRDPFGDAPTQPGLPAVSLLLDGLTTESGDAKTQPDLPPVSPLLDGAGSEAGDAATQPDLPAVSLLLDGATSESSVAPTRPNRRARLPPLDDAASAQIHVTAQPGRLAPPRSVDGAPARSDAKTQPGRLAPPRSVDGVPARGDAATQPGRFAPPRAGEREAPPVSDGSSPRPLDGATQLLRAPSPAVERAVPAQSAPPRRPQRAASPALERVTPPRDHAPPRAPRAGALDGVTLALFEPGDAAAVRPVVAWLRGRGAAVSEARDRRRAATAASAAARALIVYGPRGPGARHAWLVEALRRRRLPVIAIVLPNGVVPPSQRTFDPTRYLWLTAPVDDEDTLLAIERALRDA